MENKNPVNETNLIRRYLLEHPELNKGNNKVISSLIDKQANADAGTIIGKLSEVDNSSTVTAELAENVDMTKIEERSDLEKILAASISIAKERNQLPEPIKEKVKSPEEIASNAFDSTTIIEVIQKTANGDFSGINQLKDYLVDMATVKTIAIANSLVSQGMEYFKAMARAAALTYGGESLEAFVDYVLEYVVPIIETTINAAVASLLRKCAAKIKQIGGNLLSHLSEKSKAKNVKKNIQVQQV